MLRVYGPGGTVEDNTYVPPAIHKNVSLRENFLSCGICGNRPPCLLRGALWRFASRGEADFAKKQRHLDGFPAKDRSPRAKPMRSAPFC